MILELYKAYIWPVKRTENLPKRPKSDTSEKWRIFENFVALKMRHFLVRQCTSRRTDACWNDEKRIFVIQLVDPLNLIIQFESWRRKLTVGKYQKIYQWIKRLN